jgi:hypothetical protein
MKRIVIASLLLTACGSPKRDSAEAMSPSQELKDAAESVIPRLLRCPSGLPGKPECSDLKRQSDALGQAGYWSLAYGSDVEIDAAVHASIDDDGRPWRSPEHRTQRHGDFSRDHMISLAQWSFGSKDTETLRRVIRYAQHHDWKVCPDTQKCLLTPGILSVLGDVATSGQDAAGRPYGTNIPAAVHEGQILIEAKSQERCDLVLDKSLLKALTGNLTRAYVDAAKMCSNKVPLYGAYVRAVVTDGDVSSLVPQLTATLQAWQGPSAGGHWTADGTGWALVALAKMLDE